MSAYVLRSRKRAQMKMFETMGVLIVFSLIFVIGMNFYTKIQTQSFMDAKAKFEEFDSVKMSLMAAHLPEIACTMQNVVDGSCVDIDKAMALSTLSQQLGGHYVEIFGEGKIWIESATRDDIVLYNMTPAVAYATSLTPHPIVLHNVSTRRNEFAVLYVEKMSPVTR